jgi:retron-type reverse transcriptase
MDNIFELQSELLQKTYQHRPYFSFNISDLKPRNIHKASVRDRLLHHLLHQELYPFFHTKFIYDSYSCQLEKGTHKAMRRFAEMAGKVSKNGTRTCWVLKCDIRKFFANIDHAILKSILARYVEDSDILELLEKVIDSFHTAGKEGVGVPLGNLTSQLLVNVYMSEFDRFVKRALKVRCYIRFADDFVLLSDDRTYLENLLPQIEHFLNDCLNLQLHEHKVSIKTIGSGVDYLGWVHFHHHRVLRTATKRRMLKQVQKNPRPASMASYLGMLKHGNGFTLQSQIKKGLDTQDPSPA